MKRFVLLFLSLTIVVAVFSQSPSGKYFVFLNTNPDRPEIPEKEVNAIQAAHLANMDSLAKAKKLMAAGPFHEGGGFFILSAESAQDAQNMINSDPAIRAGRFTTEMYPLMMSVGGICPVGDTYEMTEYQFITYVPVEENIKQETVKKLEKMTNRHVNYLKANFYKRGLIADGDFGPGKGGFLVAYKTDDDDFDTFLKYDPYNRSELYKLDIKILWVAQGTFCERKKQ